MSGLLLTNIYNSIVDAPNWCNNIPESIENSRSYFETSNTGIFFRVFSPMNQIFAIIALMLFWKTSKRIRLYFCLALVFALLGDVLTFGYFYPRNDIMFNAEITNNLSQITDACHEINLARVK